MLAGNDIMEPAGLGVIVRIPAVGPFHVGIPQFLATLYTREAYGGALLAACSLKLVA